jgi:hypothetical protein
MPEESAAMAALGVQTQTSPGPTPSGLPMPADLSFLLVKNQRVEGSFCVQRGVSVN